MINKNPAAIKKIPPRDVRNLLEDLQIYQIELEKHSNALQKAHENLVESKEQYRSFLANIPVGVFRSTPQGKLIAMNLALIKMLGYESEEEVLKIPPVNLYVDPARRKELMEQLRIKGSLTDFEIKLRHRDGSDIWTAFSISPVEDDQGNLIYLDGIVRNITEIKQTEKELERKITELNSFINNIPDMAWIKDADCNFIIANKAFGNAVGMDPEYLANHTCAICFGEEAAKKFKEDDKRVLEIGKQIVIEESINDAKGNKVFLETIKSPIFNESGEVIGTVGIARDITERKQAEEKDKEQVKELRLKNIVFECSITANSISDNNGIITHTNPEFLKMWGY
ncbi:MAG: PAS domain-containing protein, partial [Desulfobulbaceae bacterium]|nr:PAS domain-containing protein [Desulfobulbaceae bacterium]